MTFNANNSIGPKLDLRNGDSRELLKTLADDSIDSVVCDPPYGLVSVTDRCGADDAAEIQYGNDGAFQRISRGFMGQEWDGQGIERDPLFWKEVLRVLKPGGHLLAFGGTRTSHRMVCAIEDAGFEIRDTIYCWLYAQGMPKSHNVGLNIDKTLGAGGNRGHAIAMASNVHPTTGEALASGGDLPKYVGISDEAKLYDGWGTGLKPTEEPITLARKRLSETSVAKNMLKWGTGAINIDACRVETDDILTGSGSAMLRFNGQNARPYQADFNSRGCNQNELGRWPSNTILVCACEGEHEIGCHVRELDEQSGYISSGYMAASTTRTNRGGWNGLMPEQTGNATIGDSGGASRFFYVAKPSKRERGEGNFHPTVKPIQLLRYLQRLVTPKGGVTLDLFMGSGSTGIAAQLEGFDYIGFEKELPYFQIAVDRTGQWHLYENDITLKPVKTSSQLTIFDNPYDEVGS